MLNVLVTGANGQLASCIRDLEGSYESLNFTFASVQELDILSKKDIRLLFEQTSFDYCVNCAAYTAVDKAEEQSLLANEVNYIGVKNIAQQCKESNTTLIHISTDFVFDGSQTSPIKADAKTNPINKYGESKLAGDQAVIELLDKFYILRTSWLYSEHGKNFVKTMIALSEKSSQLSIVGDQIGSPTYAGDLAKFICNLMMDDPCKYGVYNYSNNESTSWYELACRIFELQQININVNKIKTIDYPTPADRPKYSVLCTKKTQETFGVEVTNWDASLKLMLEKLHMKTLLEKATKAAVEAGKEIMKVYSRPFQVSKKEDKSPLTQADLIANEVIQNILASTNYPIISEENKEIDFKIRQEWTRCWIVDPLDGTKEFINRNGEFTVNIALIENNKPLLGVIYVPDSGILYFANANNKDAFSLEIQGHKIDEQLIFKKGQRLRIKNKIGNEVRVVGSRSHMNKSTKEFINELRKSGKKVEIVSKGSSLKFCLLAEGKADIYPRYAPTMEWDTAAGHAICNAVNLKVIAVDSEKELFYNKQDLLNPWFTVH